MRASRDSVGYLLKKFLGRHRTGALAATAVVATLAAFGTLYVTQLRVERNRSRQEAQKAAEVASFLRSLFEVSGPEQSEGRDVTARELLDRGAQRIETELVGQPEVQAAMMQVIGDVYHDLGYLDQALPLLERALQRRRELLGNDHLDVASSARALAELTVTRGQPAQAEALLREALGIQQAALRENEEVGTTMLRLGYVLNSLSQYDSAETVYRRALALRQKLFGTNSIQVADARASLAHALLFRGDYENAAVLFRTALGVFRDSLSDLHPKVRDNSFYLGDVLYRLGDYSAAETVQRENLRLDAQVLGPEHYDVVTGMNTLALLLVALGKFEESDTLFARALALRRRIFGEQSRFVAQTLSDWGILKMEWGDLVAADSLMRKALALTRATLGDAHAQVESTLGNLGTGALLRGEHARARDYLIDAIRRNAKRDSAQNITRANQQRNLARTLVKLGQRDSAERMFRRSLETMRARAPGRHPDLAAALVPYGELLVELARAREAEPLLRAAVAILEHRFSGDHYRVAEARLVLSLSLARLDGAAEAESLALAAHRVIAARFGPGNWRVRESAQRMASLYEALARPVDAARYREAAR